MYAPVQESSLELRSSRKRILLEDEKNLLLRGLMACLGHNCLKVSTLHLASNIAFFPFCLRAYFSLLLLDDFTDLPNTTEDPRSTRKGFYTGPRLWVIRVPDPWELFGAPAAPRTRIYVLAVVIMAHQVAVFLLLCLHVSLLTQWIFQPFNPFAPRTSYIGQCSFHSRHHCPRSSRPL